MTLYQFVSQSICCSISELVYLLSSNHKYCLWCLLLDGFECFVLYFVRSPYLCRSREILQELIPASFQTCFPIESSYSCSENAVISSVGNNAIPDFPTKRDLYDDFIMCIASGHNPVRVWKFHFWYLHLAKDGISLSTTMNGYCKHACIQDYKPINNITYKQAYWSSLTCFTWEYPSIKVINFDQCVNLLIGGIPIIISL